VRTWRILGGLFHAGMHLAAAFMVGWVALLLTVRGFGLSYGSTVQLMVSGLVTIILGAVAGSFILGLYLFVSIRLFGRHSNEAFSSLRIQDYKQWLRLRIDSSGKLTIYAIAIDHVARRWRAGERGGEPTFTAHDARATAPRLIDRVEVSAGR
jgi:membrane-bound ClpP family serine protease